MTILLAVLAGTAGVVAFDSRVDGGFFAAKRSLVIKPGEKSNAAISSATSAAPSTPGDFKLPGRPLLGDPRAEIFGPHNWQPPAPKTAAAPAAPAAPTAPPLPYKFAGKLVREGRTEFLLSRGDLIFTVREGDTLDGGYRVESLKEGQITLLYLPLAHKEVIPAVSSLSFPAAAAPAQANPPSVPAPLAASKAPSTSAVSVSPPPAPIPTSAVVAADPKALNGPAQLLWEGPQQVKLGSRFDVALKVTSNQPLHATPMLLRFDPAFLEFVALKPGKFYGGGGGNFSYRANADGSIFVGASGQTAMSASDAELLVLTFRPLKSAPAAELSVASLNLQGPAGQPIAFGQLATFKTSIAP